MSRLRRHPLLTAAAVVLVVLVGVGTWLWFRARESTPVSESSALREFRAAGGAAEARAPGTPRPGVYTYRVSGWERGTAGPIALRRDLPGQAPYVVSAQPGGFQAELDLSAQHIEGVRYRATAGGLRETWRRTKVTFLGFGRDDKRALDPSILFMPARPRVGQTWRGAYRAGDLPVTERTRVLRQAEVAIDGRRLPALVVESDSVTGGAHPGTRRETLWWSPALGLALRWDLKQDIGGVVGFTVRAGLTLESTEPRT